MPVPSTFSHASICETIIDTIPKPETSQDQTTRQIRKKSANTFHQPKTHQPHQCKSHVKKVFLSLTVSIALPSIILALGALVNTAYYGPCSLIGEFMSAASELFSKKCLLQFEVSKRTSVFSVVGFGRFKCFFFWGFGGKEEVRSKRKSKTWCRAL